MVVLFNVREIGTSTRQ